MSAVFEIAPPVSAERRRVVEVRTAIPVVRHAILTKFDPFLTDEQTKVAHAMMEEAWPDWRERFRAHVATLADIAVDDLEFSVREKRVRRRIDGKTPMIDLPRVHSTRTAAKQIDQRNCCALCLDRYSSKIWARVGSPKGSTGVPIAKLRGATQSLRDHAQASSEWFYQEFFRLTKEAFKINRRRRVGLLEVTTVALQVEGTYNEEVFDSWLLQDDQPNLENATLRRLLESAANVDFDLRGLMDDAPDSFWMSIPQAVALRSGELVSRRFLYFGRPIDGGTQVVGVGFDDSGSGELANQVALKISALIANRI